MLFAAATDDIFPVFSGSSGILSPAADPSLNLKAMNRL
jgi:hypothetical protein